MKKRFSLGVLLIILLGFSTLSRGATFDKAEYKTRRANLMNSISDGIAVILGSEERKQNSNFIYFTGVEEPNAMLIIDGMKKESILFLSSAESDEKVTEMTGIEKVMPISQATSLLSSYQAQTDVIYTLFGRISRTDASKGLLNPGIRISRELNFIKLIREMFPSFRFKDLGPAIGELRVIKSPAEIKIMREAARISSLAHIEVLRCAKPGMYEWELAAIYEYTVKRLGGQGLGYGGGFTSEPKYYNGHYSANSRKIEDGDIVMPDVGGEYNHYVVDISLTFPINGKFTPRQRRLNRIVCAVEDAMQSVFRPGIRSIDMLEEVQELVAKKGFDITVEEMYGIEVQHWIGLDVHDVIEKGPSKRTTILQPGMVLASDPAIKIRDENGNVIDGNKIENTVLITEDGCENLTFLVPRTVEEIERVMAEKGITDFLEEQNKLITRGTKSPLPSFGISFIYDFLNPATLFLSPSLHRSPTISLPTPGGSRPADHPPWR